MKPLTLNQKRFVAGVWLVVFLFAIGNEYLEWGVFGGSAKLIRSIMMFVGLLALVRFGPRMFEEMHAHISAQREAEKAAERERDKSNDTANTHQLRRSLGMPLDASNEPAAQQSAPEDALKQRASER
jgi:uncharacterized membrane protein